MTTAAVRAAGAADVGNRDAARIGWLRSPRFDLVFIVGIASFALGLGALVAARPALFFPVLAADLWLLAYPHVGATFARIAVDRPGALRLRVLLFALPPIVLAATAGVFWLGGALALNTLYFHWQTYHYTKQSFGIARAYHRARGIQRDALGSFVVFAFPAWGLLHRGAERVQVFYGAPIALFAAPRAVDVIAGAIAFSALLLFVWRGLRRARTEGARDLPHALFVLSHVAVTLASYVLVRDITLGWLAINVWHNAQYLFFVYARNARTLEDRRDRRARLGHPAVFVGTCLAGSALFYFALSRATEWGSSPALPVLLVCHLAVNFHHYVVDAVIWRRPRRAT